MADKLFPMYCGLDAISGMYAEKAACNEMLTAVKGKERAIALININGCYDWIYGQCNFKHESDHLGQFKFSNTFDALKTQNVIRTLINKPGVDWLFFVDGTLLAAFSNDSAFHRYERMFVLLSRDATGYVRPAPSVERSGIRRAVGRLFGGA